MTELKKLTKIKKHLENDLKCDDAESSNDFSDEKQKLSGLKPKGKITAPSIHINDFLEKKFLHRPLIIDPWLRQGTIALLYAKRGLGKTWFSLAIAIAVTRGLPIGAWKTITPVGCLYLDGEMACEELQSRLRQLTIGLPPERAPLHIISSEDLKSNNKPTIYLVDQKCRDNILDDLKQDKFFRLLIIDNLSCLAPQISENSKQDYDAINQWLLELRAIGVAVIMVHHTGKNGAQRGTSAREDNIDVSISLTEVNNSSSHCGASFTVNFTKARGIHGNVVSPFDIEIIEDETCKLPWKTMNHNNDHISTLFDD